MTRLGLKLKRLRDWLLSTPSQNAVIARHYCRTTYENPPPRKKPVAPVKTGKRRR